MPNVWLRLVNPCGTVLQEELGACFCQTDEMPSLYVNAYTNKAKLNTRQMGDAFQCAVPAASLTPASFLNKPQTVFIHEDGILSPR